MTNFKIPKKILTAVKSRRRVLMRAMETVLNGKNLNKEMRFTFLGDMRDHLVIFNLLEIGNVKKAASICIDLDTDSREHIPNAIYDYLCDIYEDGKVAQK
jgi:hypothetical protein